MKKLKNIESNLRLYTYKVVHDYGNAPNPYHGICTLGICKPSIRRVAKRGDVIVGFAPASKNESRIIYCMIVEHSISWGNYINICAGADGFLDGIDSKKLAGKIPCNNMDSGDCIWTDADQYKPALNSLSRHNGINDFKADVCSGENVLLSTKFWYFGSGKDFNICLDINSLREIIPKRNYKSNINNNYRANFVEFFNEKLEINNIKEYGVYGEPSLPSQIYKNRITASCCPATNRLDNYCENSTLILSCK